VLLLGADHIENSFLSVVACIRVYKAVTWQRVDQIRYNMLKKQVPGVQCHAEEKLVTYFFKEL
jgi:hypothetical protein